MQTTIYIADTSVLYDLLVGHEGFGKTDCVARMRWKAERLFSGKYRVLVPMHAFLEIAEQFFQTRIDVDDYNLWYRKRKTVFQNRFVCHLTDPNGRIELLREVVQSYRAANRIMDRIHPVYLDAIRQDPRLSEKKDRNPKFLDGMDAVILEEAVVVARHNSGALCRLVTGDRAFALAVRHLREAYDGDVSYAPPESRGHHDEEFVREHCQKALISVRD